MEILVQNDSHHLSSKNLEKNVDQKITKTPENIGFILSFSSKEFLTNPLIPPFCKNNLCKKQTSFPLPSLFYPLPFCKRIFTKN